MPEHDEHEPSEGYAGVHVAEELVAFPEFDVKQAVEKDVLDVFEHRGRGDEGQEKLPAVLMAELEYDAHHADQAVAQHEYHSKEEWQHKRIES